MHKKIQTFSIIILAFILVTITIHFFNYVYQIHKKIYNASSPNVIFIILDAARADHFSCYGYEKNTTPYMDKLARKGAIFLKHFSNATHTYEAIPEIFFSRYFSAPVFQRDAFQFGIEELNPETASIEFDDQQIFLPDILSQNWYTTALFHNHGWYTKDSYLVRKFNRSFYLGVSKRYPSDEKIITSVISWIKKNKKRKFFVYCHIMSPHLPYTLKYENAEFFESKETSLSAVDTIRKKLSNTAEYTTEGWTQEDLKYFQALYDSNLKHSDRWVGKLYDELIRLGIEDKTLVIISSDHGENLGQHGHLIHGGLPWDSVTRVPLIMIYPPKIPSGIRFNGLTESIDIMPTILDISEIGLPPSKTMDGISLFGAIQNSEDGKRAVFTNESIRTEEYKYIITEDFLFDLRKDPDEKINIADHNHLVREKLKNEFNKSMAPYMNRYKESKRREALNFPFYFRITDFKLSPEHVFEECYDKRSFDVVLKNAFPKKSWLLNKDFFGHGLFYIASNGPSPPITLSSFLPNGTYRVFILLKSSDKISCSAEETGFQYRFNRQSRFIFPIDIKPLKNHKNPFHSYLDLGKTKIKDKKFSIQISFLPSEMKKYAICHIKFVPLNSRKEKAIKEYSEEELSRRKEHLKALGYL